ncbi:MAG: PACE efflux transporter [Rhodoferax sp.]|uniref:PACE efflux transporter n=1 Tax=Rhodoferax sp. TaxID=50421 RepID=UPI002ACE2D45|nr:PACE efflux transporter [Rhodoferax sp.]MDZ7892524.1 PACE efflux transporter [Rhodoferax sp.]
MSPIQRRILQAALYEGIAIAVVTPTLALAFSHPPGSALALAVVMSSIALAWNYIFNSLFERWEAQQAVKGRSPLRRFVHGLGFEGGLAIILMPVMAYWLDISLWAAFVADLGLLVFFFFYTVGFTWAFDRIFGLPQSAR